MNKMNQTQTRSPRKRLLSLILAVILMIGLLPISAFATSASAQAGEDKAATQDSEFLRIFHLDCGRKYFTVSEIEGIIDQLAENHFTHIQLAFGNDGLRFLLDDMSLTVNGTEYDSKKVTAAIKNGNSSYNSDTSAASGELNQGDMDAIIKYANDKGIQVIPMFNAPGHMYTVVKAKSELGMGNDYKNVETYGQGKSPNWAIKPTDETAVAFAEALLQKYAAYFASKGSTMFNVGADESGLSSDNYLAYAKMVNAMNKIVKSEGMKTLAYNDGIYHTSYSSALKGKGENGADFTFDTDIIICYWTDGANLATVETLLGKGFEVLNNTNDWYYVLGDFLFQIWAGGQWGYETALNGIKNTPVTRMKDGKDYANSKRLLGSILCVWCDGPSVGYDENGYSSSSHPGAGQTNRQSVYNLIAEMAKQNPDYFKETKPELSVGTAQGVTVSAAKDGKYQVILPENGGGTVQLSLVNLTAQHITWTSGNEDVATVSTNGLVTFTGEPGTVTITATVPSAAGAESAAALLSNTNDNGTATYSVTFEVKAAGELPVEEITVQEGRTYDVTLKGNWVDAVKNLSNDYVQVDAAYNQTGEKELQAVTQITSGEQYLIVNQRTEKLLTNSQDNTWDSNYYGLNLFGTAATDSKTLWTITTSGSGYTVQYNSTATNNYLNIGENTASIGSKSTLTLSYSPTGGIDDATGGYWNISSSGYYLNNLGETTCAGGWKDNAAPTDAGSKWTIYRIADKSASDTTTVTFKGVKKGGPVDVPIGDTIYRITVTEKKNVEIPISIIDYRADGLLFDFQVGKETYDYGLVHNYDSEQTNTILATSNGGTLVGSQYGTKISGTTLENTGYISGDSYSGYYYLWGNKWSRSGMVEDELGSNGMPVYTNATVARVAQELAAGNYNSGEMAGVVNDNDVIYDTFLRPGATRSVVGKDAEKMSTTFASAKTWSNITNAYDLAWYLLNTLYQADTNVTTVTGTDGAGHAVPIYGMKVDAYDRLILTENNGVYSFDAANKKSNYDTESRSIYEDDTASSLQFYPIDGLGYDAILGDTTDKTDSPYQKDENGNITATVRPEHPNGSYTLRGEAQFVYQDNLYFEFSGDDDVYMYINGVLALDLGGAHGICTKRVNLKDVATKCHLTPGEVATFTFFYMERNSDASNFKIETNMELVQRDINVEKKAYNTSYANEYASGTAVINGTTVAYDLIVTNKSNSPMSQIKLTDTDSLGGKVTIGSGVDVSPVVTPGTPNDKGTVALGQGNGYVLFITDSTGTEVANTRKSLSSLQALSDEIAKLELPAGQSLHVRFLTATTKINDSKILDYINTVEVSATVGGQALSDKASHELYSYNANDTGRTYVVDFGLPLEIHSIFDATAQNNIGDVSYNPGKNNLKYGTVVVKPDRYNTTLTYTRTADKTIDGAETIVLDVQYTMGSNKVTLEKTLTIIPASNVYYEDSLATFTDGSGAASGADWKLVDNKGAETTEGTAPTQALEELGKHSNVYGHDGAYNSSSMLSMGTAHKVTVTAAMLEAYNGGNKDNFAWPTAQFTFKGTGFDIISLTDNTSGAIMVTVEGVTDTTYKKNFLVNNYYGYAYDKDKNEWVTVASGDSNAIYQIPVMKVNGIPYGEYKVTIGVLYNSLFDKTGNSAYSFWLDAVRIYDPMGEYAGYTADNEGYPQYIKLHDEVVKKTATPNGNALFIDGAEKATVEQYTNLGPNNEVYLMKGQAITFKLTGTDVDKIASIQIGAKAPKGTVELKVNGNEVVGNLSTATEMYYDITTLVTNDNNYQVTITNVTGNILSLTNLKITYSEKGSVSLGTLNTQEQESAVSLVRALFTAPVATFSPETFEADWGRAVRAGKRATLTVKTSADVESITVDGQAITSYTTRTQRTGWGWWSPKVTYHVFTYTITAPAQTTDYAVCAVNAEGTASEAVTATLTVKPTTWWNWWF